jgi:hypothetical protein
MTVQGRSQRRVSGNRGRRACIVWCVLFAVAWPSLGPLRYVVHDFDEHVADAERTQANGVHRIDASSIPGSPTHPDDHHCPECEVLKHLTRCVLALPALAVLAPVVVGLTTFRIDDLLPLAANPIHAPPARAPPLSIV